MKPLTCLVVGLFLAPLPGAADDGPPLFALHAADGTTAVGPVGKIAADWSIRLGGARPSLTAGADVITLRRQGLPLPPTPLTEQVVLSNGDRLPLQAGKPLRSAGERLECSPQPPLRLPGASALTLPLAAVALVWIAPPDGTEEPALLLRRLLAARRSSDVVLLRNGDTALGTVIALDRETVCRLEAGKKSLEVPFARVAAVAFSPELLAHQLPKGPYGHLVLAGGGRLALASAQVDVERQMLVSKMLLGVAVEVPLAQVVALDLRQGRATYLSDLEPRAFQHTPFLGISWPLVKDGSVAGRDLRLAGGTHDKGLGLHSKSILTYDLAGKYEWLEALVGLDEQTGRRGQARISVLVDGKARDLGLDRELSGRDGALPLRIDVRGGRELTLVVDFGRQGDVEAHVDWADARLIKSR